MPERARTAALQPLLERVRALPPAVQPWALEGVRRTLDYQDPDYAQLYLARLERIAALDRGDKQLAGHALTQATARGLALWMTFEDTIRVADLKTRVARFARVAADSGARPGQLFGITDFMRPRVAEIAGTLPAGLGSRLLRSPRLVGWLTPLHRRQADPHPHGVRFPAAARRGRPAALPPRHPAVQRGRRAHRGLARRHRPACGRRTTRSQSNWRARSD